MKELKLDNLRTTGTTVGDVYFPQTDLLLPFDGANGATTTSDLSNSNHAVTFGGNSAISTAQSKFGASSLGLDGTDYITLPSTICDFGLADFTIECWIRSSNWNHSDAGGYYSIVLYSNWSGGSPPAEYWLITIQTNGTFKFWTRNLFNITSTTALSTDTWHHIAFVRSSGVFTYYLNGVSDVSSTNTYDFNSSSYAMTGLTRYIGSSAGSTYGVLGYIDDFRITKGLARYTSSFTPPTTAHLTSAGDVNKHIVVNSDADGVAIGTGGINQARIAKAWVNFNGTGTVAIRSSYNVSSITDNGTGIYTVNFSSNMTDTNYAVSGSLGSTSASAGWVSNGNNQDSHTVNNTTSSCRVSSAYQSVGGHFDALVLSVNIFGN
ncbi:MAG: LamG domain-containing protein [Anaerolineales bacterium]|jgi:hypothetical protein|nr:LamG domain-containing protein [Anaerolineales bacterium]